MSSLSLLKNKNPQLENGDRLTCPKFERRYQAMPNHQEGIESFEPKNLIHRLC